MTPSPLAGEGGARSATPSGRVRGYDDVTLKRAKRLRRELTDAERTLWSILRNRQVADCKFRRQQPIGPYIADFVCHERRLIIEADGGQHLNSKPDQRRDDFLTAAGYTVLRFWNDDILTNLDGVADQIRSALTSPHPPTAPRRAPPSPSRGEGLGETNA